jgi:hypothetical protein
MKLQTFIDQIIKEIWLGAKRAGVSLAPGVEMNIAITNSDEVCQENDESIARITVTWRNDPQLSRGDSAQSKEQNEKSQQTSKRTPRWLQRGVRRMDFR